MKWKSGHSRPEDEFEDSEDFYASEDSRTHSSQNIERTQRKLTLRAVELLHPALGSRVLDAGCGNGFSTKVLKELGFAQVTGVDSSRDMVQQGILNGLHVVLGNFTSLPFPENSFDVVVSISAFQWVSKDAPKLAKTVAELRRVLAKGGSGVIQFYPKSSNELEAVEKAFRSTGFTVKTQTDNPRNARKRRVFVLFERP
ncbi:MAG: methyltransferase domain-containing protein [Candidatus Micrarchaeota archaeon]